MLTVFEAEEIQNASTVVPWVMIASIMLDGVMGFALLVSL
jgi:choline transport protein